MVSGRAGMTRTRWQREQRFPRFYVCKYSVFLYSTSCDAGCMYCRGQVLNLGAQETDREVATPARARCRSAIKTVAVGVQHFGRCRRRQPATGAWPPKLLQRLTPSPKSLPLFALPPFSPSPHLAVLPFLPPPAGTMVAPGLIPALLFALVVVGALALSRLPVRPHTLSGLVSVGVAAPQAHVYALLTDLSRFSHWFGSVTAATVLPPSEAGRQEGADTDGDAAAAANAAASGSAAALAVEATGGEAPVGRVSGGDGGDVVAPSSPRLVPGTRFRLTITEAGTVEHHTAEVTAATPPSRVALRSHGSDADGSGKVMYVFNLAEQSVPAAGGGGAGGAATAVGEAAVQTTVHCAFDVEMPCSAAIGVLLPLVRGLARWQLRGYLTKFKALAEAGAGAAADGAPAAAAPAAPAARGVPAGGGGATAQPAATVDVAGSGAADDEADADPPTAAVHDGEEQPPRDVAASAVATGAD